MSFFGDMLGFEKFNLKGIWDQARKNPERLLLGAADPVGSKMWGGILGKEYQPMINEFGGPTDQRFQDAQAAGIDTGFSKGSHDIAKAIAAMYAGNYGAGQAGIGEAANGGKGNFGNLGNTGMQGLFGGQQEQERQPQLVTLPWNGQQVWI